MEIDKALFFIIFFSPSVYRVKIGGRRLTEINYSACRGWLNQPKSRGGRC
jgi:hypothetical protein